MQFTCLRNLAKEPQINHHPRMSPDRSIAIELPYLRGHKSLWHLAFLCFIGLFHAEAQNSRFEQDIAPLFSSQCIECHNSQDLKGELDLTSKSGFDRGGESGEIFDSISPESSLLLKMLQEGRMPPKERGRSRALPSKEIAQIQDWLQSGAPWTGKSLSRFDHTTSTRAGRDWWALRPVVRPALPSGTPSHPVDSFIHKQLQAHQFTPSSPATKRQLIRRVSFDLIGLPPTMEEIIDFEEDKHPDAYERLLDRLLSSPHYGERWGRYWLDVIRFAETDGYERDRPKPNAWRYRDWVINAFNEDLPYSSFITDQLAGDEKEQSDEQSVIATGMLRMGTWNDEPNDPADYVYERLEDMVHTTSSAFLGLTIKCARCHDHKFDPIQQADYYRVASYFWAGYIGQGNQGGPSQEQLGYDNVYGWTDKGRSVQPIRLLINGERHKPGQEIPPQYPSFLPTLDLKFELPPKDSKTSRRRLQFAQWISHPNNPLTPRVLVNRIWKQHFGNGLVRTPNNFGFKSDPPTHPELLDWLAAELVHPSLNAGVPWTMKRLHKIIMTSETYQQSSLHANEAEQKDSENRMLWRFPRLRLDAEALRDAMLVTSGALNPAMGGPSFFPRMSKEALEGLSRKEAAWQESKPTDRARRSVYMMTQRSRLLPLMTTFDFTETTSTCAKRNVTTVAPQALALLNNEFVHEQSAAMAHRVRSEASSSTQDQIELAWEYALQRAPTPKETEQANAHILQQLAHYTKNEVKDAEQRALASLCHVLLNTNEFIYLD